MKTESQNKRTVPWCLGALVVLLSVSGAPAQSYAITGSVLAGGGGTSTNGQFSLSGTIGQPDAGPKLAGGTYTLEGGFWGVAVAIQMPGAPLLSVTRSGASVIISWAAAAGNFALEVTGSLAMPIPWQAVGQTPVVAGADNTVTLAASPGNKFYRLRQATR